MYSVPDYILQQRVPCCIVKLSHEPFKNKYLNEFTINNHANIQLIHQKRNDFST